MEHQESFCKLMPTYYFASLRYPLTCQNVFPFSHANMYVLETLGKSSSAIGRFFLKNIVTPRFICPARSLYLHTRARFHPLSIANKLSCNPILPPRSERLCALQHASLARRVCRFSPSFTRNLKSYPERCTSKGTSKKVNSMGSQGSARQHYCISVFPPEIETNACRVH